MKKISFDCGLNSIVILIHLLLTNKLTKVLDCIVIVDLLTWTVFSGEYASSQFF